MPRHTLTLDEQITGTRKALANPKTPKQFLPSMKFRLEQLEERRFQQRASELKKAKEAQR